MNEGILSDHSIAGEVGRCVRWVSVNLVYIGLGDIVRMKNSMHVQPRNRVSFLLSLKYDTMQVCFSLKR